MKKDILDSDVCVHGGPRKKCKGQCKTVVKVEGTNTYLYCLLDKDHKGIHEVMNEKYGKKDAD